MQALLTKRKFVLQKLNVGTQRIITFEIGLPSGVKRITGVIFTNTASFYSNRKIGTVCLQSLGASDVFLTMDVFDDLSQTTDEDLIGTYNLDFDGHFPYQTGNVPKRIPLEVDGRTEKVKGWFKPVINDDLDPFTFCIYLEYEEQKKLIETTVAP
jgi:hypothetical protein